MSREEIRKLLGGYATDTLTAEERQALFAAALEDQELFDALGREQSLRDLLRDPAARAHLLAALDAPAPAPWYRRWWRPLPAAAMAVVLATVAIVAVRRHPPAAPEVTVAKLETPVAVAAPAAVPASAPATAPAGLKTSVGKRPGVVVVKKPPPVTLARVAAPPAPPVAAPPPPWPRVELQAVPPAALPPSTKGTAAPKVGAATDGAVVISATSAGLTSAALEKARAENFAQSLGAVSGFRETANALFYGGLSGGASGGGGRAGAGAGAMGGIISGAPPAARPMAKAAAAPAGHLGIQYRILRKADSGEFVEADSAATGLVAAGTTFKLQITANDGGYVRLLQEAPDGAWREIVNHAVERMQPIETEPIELDQPGRVKFYLAFSRQPLPSSNVAQPDDDILVDRGRVVTVAGRAVTPQLSFNITLTVQ
jgi:hypothetical protein